MAKLTDAERLMSKVVEDNGCWLWRGDPSKYGFITFRSKTWRVHRASYTIFCGEIPTGLFVCHHCDRPGCINPKHLFVGDGSANMKDMVAKGRNPALITSDQSHFKDGRAPRGERASGSKIRETDAISIINRAASGELTSSIASAFGVDRSTIQYILRGTTWSYLPRPPGLPRPIGAYGRSALTQGE